MGKRARAGVGTCPSRVARLGPSAPKRQEAPVSPRRPMFHSQPRFMPVRARLSRRATHGLGVRGAASDGLPGCAEPRVLGAGAYTVVHGVCIYIAGL